MQGIEKVLRLCHIRGEVPFNKEGLAKIHITINEHYSRLHHQSWDFHEMVSSRHSQVGDLPSPCIFIVF